MTYHYTMAQKSCTTWDVFHQTLSIKSIYLPYINWWSPDFWTINSIKMTLFHIFSVDATLPETNIAPENGPSQRETSIPTIHFQGRLLLVLGRVTNDSYPVHRRSFLVPWPFLQSSVPPRSKRRMLKKGAKGTPAKTGYYVGFKGHQI